MFVFFFPVSIENNTYMLTCPQWVKVEEYYSIFTDKM